MNKPLKMEDLLKAQKLLFSAGRQMGKTQILINETAYKFLNEYYSEENPVERLKRFLKESNYEKEE